MHYIYIYDEDNIFNFQVEYPGGICSQTIGDDVLVYNDELSALSDAIYLLCGGDDVLRKKLLREIKIDCILE